MLCLYDTRVQSKHYPTKVYMVIHYCKHQIIRTNDFSHRILAAHARLSLAVIHVTTGSRPWHMLNTYASLCLTFNSVWHTGAPLRYSTVQLYVSGHLHEQIWKELVQSDNLSNQWHVMKSGPRELRFNCVTGTMWILTFSAYGWISFMGILSPSTKMKSSALIWSQEPETWKSNQWAYRLRISKNVGNLSGCSCAISVISKLIFKIHANEP